MVFMKFFFVVALVILFVPKLVSQEDSYIPAGAEIELKPIKIKETTVIVNYAVGADQVFIFPAFSIGGIEFSGERTPFIIDGKINPKLWQEKPPVVLRFKMRDHFNQDYDVILKQFGRKARLACVYSNSWRARLLAQNPSNANKLEMLGNVIEVNRSNSPKLTASFTLGVAEIDLLKKFDASDIFVELSCAYKARVLEDLFEANLQTANSVAQNFYFWLSSQTGAAPSLLLFVDTKNDEQVFHRQLVQSFLFCESNLEILYPIGKEFDKTLAHELLCKFCDNLIEWRNAQDIANEKLVTVILDGKIAVSMTMNKIKELTQKSKKERKSKSESSSENSTENKSSSNSKFNIALLSKFTGEANRQKESDGKNATKLTSNQENEAIDEVEKVFSGSVNFVAGISFSQDGKLKREDELRNRISFKNYQYGTKQFSVLFSVGDFVCKQNAHDMEDQRKKVDKEVMEYLTK